MFAIPSDSISWLLLEKGGKKIKKERGGEKNPVLRTSTALVFHQACLLRLFSGVTEGDFLRSVADVLIAPFKARTETFLCGKSRPGLCSVMATSPASHSYCPPWGTSMDLQLLRALQPL